MFGGGEAYLVGGQRCDCVGDLEEVRVEVQSVSIEAEF
jgi:hypothetical protein